jgi:hypothetical protein
VFPPFLTDGPQEKLGREFFFETEILPRKLQRRSELWVKDAGLARSDCFHDRRRCRCDVPHAAICGQARRWEVEPDDSSPCPLSCGKPRSNKAGRRKWLQAGQREDEPNDCTTAGRRARRHDPHALAAALYQNLVITCRQCRYQGGLGRGTHAHTAVAVGSDEAHTVHRWQRWNLREQTRQRTRQTRQTSDHSRGLLSPPLSTTPWARTRDAQIRSAWHSPLAAKSGCWGRENCKGQGRQRGSVRAQSVPLHERVRSWLSGLRVRVVLAVRGTTSPSLASSDQSRSRRQENMLTDAVCL